jgi:hypothetical protein
MKNQNLLSVIKSLLSLHQWAPIITALSLLLLSPISGATEIAERNLRYSVIYGSHNAGELEIVLEHDGDLIKTSAISHLSAIAKMFLSGQTVETWFKITDGTARVEKGHILNHKDNGITSSFDIDRSAGKVHFKTKDIIAIEKNDVFESTSFPVVLMTSDFESLGGTTVREINPKKVRYYTYHDPVEEPLELQGKSYETWKITRFKQGNPDRTVTFWLDKTNRSPLQIISSKKGTDTVMTLLNPQ